MRIKLTLAYDGTDFCGWQSQKNGRSVQQEVEEAVFKLTGKRAKVTGSGRTDAGVHAAGQVAHLDTDFPVPAQKFYKALNPLLPGDVKALSSEEAPAGFNACTSAKKKTYRYSFYVSETENPLYMRYAARVYPAPDEALMKAACAEFIGEHDFAAFRASGSSAKTTVRTVYGAEITKSCGVTFLTVCGNGFLYNMVRIMAGAIVGAGQGRLSAEDIRAALENGARPKEIKTMPACGLCLMSAEYF